MAKTDRTRLPLWAARSEQILANVPDFIWFLCGYVIIAVAMEGIVHHVSPIEGETHPWAWLGFTHVRTNLLQSAECGTLDVEIREKLWWSPRVWRYFRDAWLIDIFSTPPPERNLCACSYFLLHLDPRGFARSGYNLRAEYKVKNSLFMTIAEYSRPVDWHADRASCSEPWTLVSVDYARHVKRQKQRVFFNLQ